MKKDTEPKSNFKRPYDGFKRLGGSDRSIQYLFPQERVQESLVYIAGVKPLTPLEIPTGLPAGATETSWLTARFEEEAADLLQRLGFPPTPLRFTTNMLEAESILDATSDRSSTWKRAFEKIQKRSHSALRDDELTKLYLQAKADALQLSNIQEMVAKGKLGEGLAKRASSYAQLEAIRGERDSNPLKPFVDIGRKGGHVLRVHEKALWIYAPQTNLNSISK